jgi:hypothetical protein
MNRKCKGRAICCEGPCRGVLLQAVIGMKQGALMHSSVDTVCLLCLLLSLAVWAEELWVAAQLGSLVI